MKTTCYLGIGLACAGIAAAAPTTDFDRYQIILDRNPFGVSGGVQAATAVTNLNLADTFAKSLRMSALLDLPAGPRVGLINTALTNQSYYLGVGEKSDDGVELVSINYLAEEAVLRKGLETVVLKLSATVTNSAASIRMFDRVQYPPSPADPSAERRSYWERHRQENDRGFAGGGAPRPSPEHLQQRLQEYQMRAIRSGLPPLPVPLTPEMDAQLVKEGVLPPQR
ncbi:MAG: hypothetical protein NTV49_06080 [Kiritimatiellaeota bacterium]|nr:hypothetical protein [Kiritimatiellota bacterium]